MSRNARLIFFGYLVVVHVSLRNPLRGAPELFDTIRKNVTNVLLPQAVAALARGERINLGELQIGPDGITYQEATLPWGQLEKVKVGGGSGFSLVIGSGLIEFFDKQTQKVWLQINSLSVPNYDVLLALADQKYEKVVEFIG